jgi:hypothetical protein
LDGEPSWNAGALQAPTIDTDPTLQSNAIVSSKFSFKFSFTYPKSHCDADKLWAYIPKSAGLRNVVDEIFLALARNAAPCPSSANVSAWYDGAAAARRGFSAYVPGVETLKLPTLHGLNSSRKRRAKTNGFPTKRIADVIQSGPSAETGSSARAKVGVWCVYAPAGKQPASPLIPSCHSRDTAPDPHDFVMLSLVSLSVGESYCGKSARAVQGWTDSGPALK